MHQVKAGGRRKGHLRVGAVVNDRRAAPATMPSLLCQKYTCAAESAMTQDLCVFRRISGFCHTALRFNDDTGLSVTRTLRTNTTPTPPTR